MVRVATSSTNSNGESVPAGFGRISEITSPGPCWADINKAVLKVQMVVNSFFIIRIITVQNSL